jgi:hypothetical protein
MRTSTIHKVDFPYTRQELLAVFALAVDEDVEKGGRYDARWKALNVWSHPWTSRAMRAESTIMGTFYCTWGVEKSKVHQIETDAGFSLNTLLQELGVLELKALGLVKHGKPQTLLRQLSPP